MRGTDYTDLHGSMCPTIFLHYIVDWNYKVLTKDAIISQLNLYLVNTNVKEAYLFGSYATDSATRNSDIDLILIYETQKRFFDRYKEFDGIYDLLAVSIDLLIYTPEEWKKVNQRLFFENMFKNKRITNVYRKT